MHKLLRSRPPVSILKLNFDGSYLCRAQRRCFEGFIRVWNGNVVRNFSGHVDSLNANEAGVFNLLIGCHELLRMEGFNHILEGGFVSAMQWGSVKAFHRWRLAD